MEIPEEQVKIANEIKIGFLVIVSVALLIWGVYFLKGIDVLNFGKKRTFYATYSKVENLNVGNIVQINGFQVGRVSDIHFLPDNSGRLVVAFTLDVDYPVASSTMARIISLDLLGSKALALVPNAAKTGDSLYVRDSLIWCRQGTRFFPLIKKKPDHNIKDGDILLVRSKTWFYLHSTRGPLLEVDSTNNENIRKIYKLNWDTLPLGMVDEQSLANNGDTLMGAIQSSLEEEVNAQIRPLKLKTEELISSVDSAVTIVQTLLNDEVAGNVAESFKSIKRAIETFEKTSLRVDTMIAESRYRLNNIFANIQTISGTLKKNSDKIDNTINNLNQISDSLAAANVTETVNNTSRVMKEVSDILEKINNGEGSIGLLIHDDKLYNELVMAAADLNLLMLDIRTNPGKYAPLKRHKKEKDLVRDSLFYNNMLDMDSALIKIQSTQRDS